VKVWIDLTNSPHVLVMRPVIANLREHGHEVQITARDFAQTLGLCERFGIEQTTIGRHRGAGLLDKARGLLSRSIELARWARPRRFDLALGHGSNDVTVAAALLRIPCSTTFDYEWAAVQHNVNCRLAQAVVVPDAIPPERLYRYGARRKLGVYPGLKEEYYLADFEPDEAVLAELGLTEHVLCWNVVPTHPGTERSNRRPTQSEVAAGRCFAEELAQGRRVVAVGRIAANALGAPYIRHPSHGGVAEFREGLLPFAPGGRPVRPFSV